MHQFCSLASDRGITRAFNIPVDRPVGVLLLFAGRCGWNVLNVARFVRSNDAGGRLFSRLE